MSSEGREVPGSWRVAQSKTSEECERDGDGTGGEVRHELPRLWTYDKWGHTVRRRVLSTTVTSFSLFDLKRVSECFGYTCPREGHRRLRKRTTPGVVHKGTSVLPEELPGMCTVPYEIDSRRRDRQGRRTHGREGKRGGSTDDRGSGGNSEMTTLHSGRVFRKELIK